jgi:hypothetical protein
LIRILAALEFGAGQPGMAALRRGWSAPEAGWVWSLGTRSTLVFAVPPASDDVILELTLDAFVRLPQRPFQRLELAVNGFDADQFVLGGDGDIRVELPTHLLRDRHEMTIALRHPDAAAPAALGAGDDPRQLAIRLSRLVLLQDTGRSALPPAAGPLMLARDWRFGWNEPTARMLVQGWARPENRYVWAAAQQSVLRVKPLMPDVTSTLILDVAPFTAGPAVPRQRIGVGTTGQALQYIALTHRSLIALDLPRPTDGADFLDITFHNFDAAAPTEGDPRTLAFRLQKATLLQPRPGYWPRDRALPRQAPAADLVAHFESLGTFCDFGLLQRRLGQEPPGLLRFAGIMTPELVHGIVHGFPLLGRPDTIRFGPRDDGLPGRSIKDDDSTIGFRAPPFAPDATDVAIKRLVAQRLGLLRRKFFEDAAGSHKIFLFYREDKTIRAEVDAVLAALSVWGDATLLWLLTEPSQPPGDVVRLGPRLLCGFLPRIDPGLPVPDDLLMRALAQALALGA